MRGAASGSGTRRESVRGGSVAASMPPHGPAPGYGTALPLFAPAGWQALQVDAMHLDLRIRCRRHRYFRGRGSLLVRWTFDVAR
ncbi:hypothetical protein E1J23_00110 [Xanthomonas gardneri]|nr:hypothetical protein BJD10_21510 [Xanthomonas hortorum pv. gardneri]NMI17959.1 hypothetical protein [Xanthomonas hortorum pv. vitians]NMI50751.1 hypothetical protein [Xanthomonas hortorum pv. taraxaci]PPU35898.1 hypothetical protein XcyCFBP4188_20815 [Xanthomonas hortorum pv. cynarae]APP86131.1 hypothetical protein BI317_20240 [Xanthomonas hortorum pv. gardneri]